MLCKWSPCLQVAIETVEGAPTFGECASQLCSWAQRCKVIHPRPHNWYKVEELGWEPGRNDPPLHRMARSFQVLGLCITQPSSHNKLPQTGQLGQQRCIFSQLRRQEVQSQGVSGFPSGHLLAVLTWPFLCGLTDAPGVSLCVLMSSSYRDTGHIRQGPTLMAPS